MTSLGHLFPLLDRIEQGSAWKKTHVHSRQPRQVMNLPSASVSGTVEANPPLRDRGVTSWDYIDTKTGPENATTQALLQSIISALCCSAIKRDLRISRCSRSTRLFSQIV